MNGFDDLPVAFCNGTTVAGGAVVHTGLCPLHGVSEVPALLWEARQLGRSEGYAEAVARLRSPEGRGAAARIMFDAIDDGSLTGRMIAAAIADYLEAAATKETTDHA